MRYSGTLDVDRLAAGDGRAHGDPVHVLEEVRDDRLAARVCGGAGRRSPTRSPSSTPTTRVARPTSCRPPAWPRSPIRPGRRRSSPSCERRRDAAVAALAVGAWRALRHAGGDVLPVPQRHRGRAAHRLRQRHRVRQGGAAPHRRVVLHPPPLRQRPAGRDRSTTSDSPTRASPPTTSPRASAASPTGSAGGMTSRGSSSSAGSPSRASRCCAQAGEVWAWDHDDADPRRRARRPAGRRRRRRHAAHQQGRSPAFLAAAPQLQIVANVAVGYNNIDVDACRERERADRHQHPGRAHRRHRRPGDGLDADGHPPAGRGRAPDPQRRRRGSGACS